MKKALTFSILLLSLRSLGQVNGIYYPPNVIPPSPDVATLFKVQDIPVDTKNGTANVSIPIYTVKDGRIEVPISISYNTAGIKVQQISGMIGLGWNFDFGGAITRQSEDINMGENRVQFTPDTTATKIQADLNYTLAYQLADGLAEKSQPEFFYHFGKYSGSFFYDVNGKLFIKSDNPNFKIQLLNYGDNAYRDDYVSGFLITTDEGIQYTFASPEFTSGVAVHVSDFLITQIFDPNTNKTVQFRYASAPTFTDSSLNQANTENYCISGPSQTQGPIYYAGGNSTPWALWNNVSQSYNQITHYTLQIDSIIFSNGLVTFQAGTNRSDGNHILINKINVYNAAGANVRTAQFYQSYFVDTTSISGYPYVPTPDTSQKNRLRLDAIGFFDNTNTEVEQYSFTYNLTKMLPAYKYNVPISGGGSNYTSCTAVDYFGYFNGRLGNQGLVPDSAISNYDRTNYTTDPLYEGNRTVDTVCAQAGVLTKVKFPSGGSIVFTYESNRFDNPTGNTGSLGQLMGGLRIKSLNYFDNDSTAVPSLQKNYTYSGAVMADMPPVSTFYQYDKIKNFTFPDLTSNGVQCVYPGTQDSKFRMVNSSPLGSMAYLDMSPVYGQVTELTSSGTTSLGKTIYYNSTESQIDYASVPLPEYGGEYGVDKGWIKNGLLDSVGYYKMDNLGNYHIIKAERNSYTDFNHIMPTIGVLAERDDIGDDYYPSDPSPFCYSTTAAALTGWYTYFTAFNTVGIRRLTQKVVYDYTDSGNVVTTYNYAYDSLHYYLRRTQTTDSKGSALLDIIKYPQDSSTFDGLTSAAHAAIDSLAGRHMLSTVIEKQHYNNGVLMSRTRTNYGVFSFSNPIIMPQILQTQKLSNSLDNRLEYNSYDFYGNVLSLSKDQDENICYLWGYNSLYPIAKVVNSATSDIAYTSFEDNSEYSGNWNITGTSRVTGDGVTGNQCFSQSGGNVVISPTIKSATVYVVSYWTKGSSPFTISGTMSGYPIKGPTINGWTYYEHLVTGVTSFQLSGTAYVDELRLYPQTAQMTTYAYTPLVGKTAECDVSDKITYYQYDAYNRLDLVLDQYHNIVKKYCYNYAGQPSNCNGTLNLNSQYDISYAYWTVQLTSVLTGNIYTFSMPYYVGSQTLIGSFPAGMYNVSITQVGSSGTHTIYFGNYTQTGTSMSLTNVPLSTNININFPY